MRFGWRSLIPKLKGGFPGKPFKIHLVTHSPLFHANQGYTTCPRLKAVSFCYDSTEGLLHFDDFDEPYWRVTAEAAARHAKADVAALQQHFKHIHFDEEAY